MYNKKMIVKFFGNSLTERNGSVPEMIARMKKSSFEYTMEAPDGCTLLYRATDGQTIHDLEMGEYDVIVLQENGEDITYGEKYADKYIFPPAQRLIDAFRLGNPDGRVILFQTWARKNGELDVFPVPKGWEEIFSPEIGNYSRMQSRINEGCDMLSLFADEIAPVGEAWQYVREHYPKIELYHPDGKHPSKAGTYLAACVISVTLFEESVANLSSLDILPAHAQSLRDVADMIALRQ